MSSRSGEKGRVVPLPSSSNLTRPIIPKPSGGLMNQMKVSGVGLGLLKPQSQKPSLSRPVPQKITSVQEKNGYDVLLSTISLWKGNENMVKELTSLKYKNGGYIIDINRKDILIEIIGMLKNLKYDDVVDFLRDAENPEYILWEQPSLDEARNNLAREITVKLSEEKGIKNVGKCKYCNSKELVFVLKQTRSGDEGFKTFIRCVECQKHWTIS